MAFTACEFELKRPFNPMGPSDVALMQMDKLYRLERTLYRVFGEGNVTFKSDLNTGYYSMTGPALADDRITERVTRIISGCGLSNYLKTPPTCR